MQGATAALRVLGLSGGLAGPLATMILADFGAEVIRVEPVTDGPGRPGPSYLLLNRGKRRIGLDLRTATGQEAPRHPQSLAWGCTVEVCDPRVGPILQIGPLAKVVGAPAVVRGPAPIPGEHTEQVLKSRLELLGRPPRIRRRGRSPGSPSSRPRITTPRRSRQRCSPTWVLG